MLQNKIMSDLFLNFLLLDLNSISLQMFLWIHEHDWTAFHERNAHTNMTEQGLSPAILFRQDVLVVDCAAILFRQDVLLVDCAAILLRQDVLVVDRAAILFRQDVLAVVCSRFI